MGRPSLEVGAHHLDRPTAVTGQVRTDGQGASSTSRCILVAGAPQTANAPSRPKETVMSTAGDKIKGKANEVIGKMTDDKGQELKGKAQQGKGEVKDRASDAADEVNERVDELQDRIDDDPDRR